MALSSMPISATHANRIVAFLDEAGLSPQHPSRPIRLQIDPSDQLIVEEERVDVVAVLSCWFRHVDLDPVPEPEQPLRSRAVPDDRVEWGQEAAGADGTRRDAAGSR